VPLISKIQILSRKKDSGTGVLFFIMTSQKHRERIQSALRAAAIHLGLSILIAIITGTVVFNLWFPYPYRELAGGLHLFWILIGVDIICGPLLTVVLFNPKKSLRELSLDLSIVALIQIAALGYGLHSIAEARPIALVFENDRMVVVSAASIDKSKLKMAPAEFQKLSWTGPILLGTRSAVDGNETLQSVAMSLQGVEPSARPDWWQSYEKNRIQAIGRMQKLDSIKEHLSPADLASLETSIKDTKQPSDKIFYFPMVSQKILDRWIVLLDENAKILGYAPIDGFH
jgi:hypothetical protein